MTTLPGFPPAALATAPYLEDGVWVTLYNEKGWPADAGRCADDLVALGARGVSVHSLLDAGLQWLTPARESAFRARGLGVTVGIGSRGPDHWQLFAQACVAVLERGLIANLDWEGSWDHAKAQGAQCVAFVESKVPDPARRRVIDCPWWAPLTQPGGSETHPGAPCLEFGRLATRDRYVQAYAYDDGASQHMLDWAAKDPGQYLHLAAAGGVPMWQIRPTFRMYRRSQADQLKTLLANPCVMLWDLQESDSVCRLSLRIVKALKSQGFTGPDAVVAFQRAAHLVADGDVGPRTLAALGLTDAAKNP